VHRRGGGASPPSLVLLSLIGGVIGTTIGLLRADHARIAEAVERADAELARDQAWDALDAMTSPETGDSLAAQPEVSAEQKNFLATAISSYRQLAQGKAETERSRNRAAQATRRVANIEGILGEPLRSGNSYLAAAKAYSALAESFPAKHEYRRMLALCYGPAGVAFGRAGRDREAEESFQEAAALLRLLRIDDPHDARTSSDQGVVLLNLAVHCRDAGRLEEAAKHAEMARALFEDLARDQPNKNHHRSSAAGCHHTLGLVAQAKNDLVDSEWHYRRAIDLLEVIRAANPNDHLTQQPLAVYQRNLGTLLCKTGRYEEGVRLLNQALIIFQQLADRFPSRPQYREDSSSSMIELANAYFGRGKVDEQLKLQRSAIEILERLVAEQPYVGRLPLALAGARCNVGNLLRGQRRFSEAIESYDKAIMLLDVRKKAGETSLRAKDYLEKALLGRGSSKEGLLNWLQASEDYRRLAGLVDPKYVTKMHLGVALWLAKGGNAAEAAAQLASIDDDRSLPAYERFIKARIEALLSKLIPSKADWFADRALASLERALQSGLERPMNSLAEKDFLPLRERDDFKKLVREASATPAVKKAPLK
jgi:tetratricopeptide (TPR) repeat protein